MEEKRERMKRSVQANDVTHKHERKRKRKRKRCLRAIRKVYLLNFLAAANRNTDVVNLILSLCQS